MMNNYIVTERMKTCGRISIDGEEIPKNTLCVVQYDVRRPLNLTFVNLVTGLCHSLEAREQYDIFHVFPAEVIIDMQQERLQNIKVSLVARLDELGVYVFSNLVKKDEACEVAKMLNEVEHLLAVLPPWAS